MRRDVPTAPEALVDTPVIVFDRSTGRYIRHMRPSGPRRSRSALNIRATSREFAATLHTIQTRLLEVPSAWHALGPYLYWPRLPQNLSSGQSASSLNPHAAPNPRWASVTRPRPNGNTPHLVSLTDIATRFGLARTCISTLNACSYASETLKFIVLNENDGWICDRHLVVYAKANLHLLPGHELPYPDQTQGELGPEYDDCSETYSNSDLIDLRSRAGSVTSLRVELSSPSSVISTPSSSMQWNNVQSSPDGESRSADLSPVALFSRVQSGQQGRTFEFVGWYELEEAEFFAPRTFELSRMLGEKCGWRNAPSAADTRCEWAKIKLVRQEESEGP